MIGVVSVTAVSPRVAPQRPHSPASASFSDWQEGQFTGEGVPAPGYG